MQNDIIKIIIADDNQTFLEGLDLMLMRKPQFEVIDQCFDGVQLVNCTNLGKADLVITDINMPKLNGIEAAKRINFRFPELPLIALTMDVENVFLEEIITAGFRGFIHKPDITSKLYDTTEAVLLKKFVFPENLQFK